MPSLEEKMPFSTLTNTFFLDKNAFLFDEKMPFSFRNRRKMPFLDKRVPFSPLPIMPFLDKNAFFGRESSLLLRKQEKDALFAVYKCPFS